MREEYNSYNIKNPDGVSKGGAFEKKVSFTNDNPRYVKEDSATSQIEWKNDISETENDYKKASASSSTVSVTMSGGVNALLGVVAASVAAGVVVVAAVVATLTMNIALYFASTYSLVFKVDIKNAQAEDFNTPIIAVLTGAYGETYEREVFKDSIYIVFDDLMPETEYTLVVKNESKVFYEQTCSTSGERPQGGYLGVSNEDKEVFVWVEGVDETYTVTAQDKTGNVIYTVTEDGKSQEFNFRIDNPTGEYYFTLTAGGKVLGFETIYIENYDYTQDLQG